MTRQLFPRIEALENKALLSHVGIASAVQRHASAQVVTHVSSRVQSELAISLTTNQSTYTVGQNVQMTLIATNDTKHNVSLSTGSTVDAFTVTQDGHVIWRSSAGLSQAVRHVVLHPGQSLTLTANWTANSTGSFDVQNRMAPKGPVAAFSVVSSPPIVPGNPPVSPPVISPVAPQLTISLATNKPSYSVGQVVQMSMTATNDSDQNETVWVGPDANVFTISQNGQTIWQSNSGPQPLSPTVEQVLAPGQSITLTANWTATAAGTFVITNELDPQGPVATFSVTAIQPVAPPISPPAPPVSPPAPPVSPPVSSPLAVSLTTNQSNYAVGQVVQMSMTATNESTQDVTVLVGPNTNVFSITENGQTIWRSNSGSPSLRPTVREVLKPGESLTLTAKWTATATGSFVVHNQLAPQGPGATFTVTAA